mmetsp:Transcript_33269/g.74792  ORF Transcript_33269/g.74792 Transcript_33269/m.74792 type:complete len:107 (-) Transcript_33269:1617-1937(-)
MVAGNTRSHTNHSASLAAGCLTILARALLWHAEIILQIVALVAPRTCMTAVYRTVLPDSGLAVFTGACVRMAGAIGKGIAVPTFITERSAVDTDARKSMFTVAWLF